MDDIERQSMQLIGKAVEREIYKAMGIPDYELEPTATSNLTSAKLYEMWVEMREKHPLYELHGKPGDIAVIVRLFGRGIERDIRVDRDPYWPGDPMLIARYAFRKTMKVVPMELFR